MPRATIKRDLKISGYTLLYYLTLLAPFAKERF
jgi:hypothetical protein